MSASSLADIPTAEMEQDRNDTIADIAVCRVALIHGVLHYGNNDSTQDRLDTNLRILAVIEAELERRGVTCQHCSPASC